MKKYKEEFKLEVLNYAEDKGINAASIKFKVNASTVSFWNRTLRSFNTRPRGRRPGFTPKFYSEEFKTDVLNYAKCHGVSKSSMVFKVSVSVIYEWNKLYDVFAVSHSMKKVKSVKVDSYADEFKLKVLYYAKSHGIFAAYRMFKIKINVIKLWNEKLKIFGQVLPVTTVPEESAHVISTPPVKQKLQKYTSEQKFEILLYALNNGVEKTVEKFKVHENLIREFEHAPLVSDYNRTKLCENHKTKKSTKDFILDVLNYIDLHGKAAASKKFALSEELMDNWVARREIKKT